MKVCLAVWIFLSILSSSTLHAFSFYSSDRFALSLKGYYKNLAFGTKRAATGDEVFAELNRIRTEWDATFYKILSTKVVWDNELIGGDYVNTEEFAGRQTLRSDPFLDMDYELVRRENFFYGQQFYRAYAKLDPGPFELTAGRQLVDWGVMRFFSPLDLFTRLPIFDIERDERVGTTAANLVIPLGSAMKINPVYAVHPDWDRSRLGGRLTRTVGRFDLSLVGGKFLQDEIFGFDFSGDVKKAGIRGEFLYDRAEFGSDFVQLAFGVDYGFENSLYLAAEYFLNGQGTNKAATIIPFPATANQLQTIHENFFTVHAKYDLFPLWTVLLETAIDVNGGSVFVIPETQFLPFDWLEVVLGALLPAGKGGGEFSAVPNVYYLETQFFF